MKAMKGYEGTLGLHILSSNRATVKDLGLKGWESIGLWFRV